MKEYQPPQAPIAVEKNPGKVSVSACILAVVSGLFVILGVCVVGAYLHLLLGDGPRTPPRWVVYATPDIAICLGILSTWRFLSQARLKARAKAAEAR